MAYKFIISPILTYVSKLSQDSRLFSPASIWHRVQDMTILVM